MTKKYNIIYADPPWQFGKPLNVTKGIIDINKIDKTAQECIARAFLPLVEDYFKDPDVQRNYELWLKKRNKKNV